MLVGMIPVRPRCLVPWQRVQAVAILTDSILGIGWRGRGRLLVRGVEIQEYIVMRWLRGGVRAVKVQVRNIQAVETLRGGLRYLQRVTLDRRIIRTSRVAVRGGLAHLCLAIHRATAIRHGDTGVGIEGIIRQLVFEKNLYLVAHTYDRIVRPRRFARIFEIGLSHPYGWAGKHRLLLWRG